MATIHFTWTPGQKGGSGQTNIGVKNAPRDYRNAVEAWLADKDAEALPTNTEFEISRVRYSGVVITMHGTKNGKISLSLQGETVKFVDFPLPDNCYSEDPAALAAVQEAFGVAAVAA